MATGVIETHKDQNSSKWTNHLPFKTLSRTKYLVQKEAFNMVYGIDLGNTYARIAKLDSLGKPKIISDDEVGAESFPVAVFFAEDGSVHVGYSALELGVDSPERLCRNIQSMLCLENIEPTWGHYLIDGIKYCAVDLYALVLKHIVNYAKASGEDVKDVVITCPAHYSSVRRDALRQAGEIAKLNVLSVVNAPLAAAANYISPLHQNQKLLVFDLGGSSLDVSILKIKAVDQIDVLGAKNERSIGGADWDKRLYQLLVQKCADECNWLTPETIPHEIQQDILFQEEDIKKRLSVREKTRFKTTYEGDKIVLEVTQRQFERITSDLVELTVECLNTALRSANITDTDVDVVLAAGGASKMHAINSMLIERFGEKVVSDSPDQVIAKGAAIVAGNQDLFKHISCFHEQYTNRQWHDGLIHHDLEIHLASGRARLAHIQGTDKVKVVYIDEKEDHPLIAKMVENFRCCLNSLYDNHTRIVQIRQNSKRLFLDASRAEAITKELENIISSQRCVDEMLETLDQWDMVTSILAHPQNNLGTK